MEVIKLATVQFSPIARYFPRSQNIILSTLFPNNLILHISTSYKISHIFSPYSSFACNVLQCVVTVVTLWIQFTSLLLIFIEAVVTASPSALEALHMYTPSSSPRTCVMSIATKPKSWVLVIREPMKPNIEGLFDVYAHLIF